MYSDIGVSIFNEVVVQTTDCGYFRKVVRGVFNEYIWDSSEKDAIQKSDYKYASKLLELYLMD